MFYTSCITNRLSKMFLVVIGRPEDSCHFEGYSTQRNIFRFFQKYSVGDPVGYLSKIADFLDLIWISKTFMVPLNVICLSTCITKLFVLGEIFLDLSSMGSNFYTWFQDNHEQEFILPIFQMITVVITNIQKLVGIYLIQKVV